MDATRGIASFDKPVFFDSVIKFADTTRITFDQVRKAMPIDSATVRKAIFQYAENSRFENIKPNTSYIKALGLKGN